MVTQMLLGSFVKQLFGRVRPIASDEHTVFLGPSLRDASYSFPSGHATAAFALAALMASYYPRWRYVFLAAALAVALARVQIDRHFFGDVLAGGVLGWYWSSWLIGWLGSRWGPRPARRRRPTGEAPAANPSAEG